MGLGDVVSDNISTLLDEITEYDYFIDYKDDIIKLIVEMLRLVNKMDGYGIQISAEQFEINLLNCAKNYYNNYFINKYETR